MLSDIHSLLIRPLSFEAIARVQATPQSGSYAITDITATPMPGTFSAIARISLTALLVLLCLCPAPAQNVGDFIVRERVATSGREVNRSWPKAVNSLWGTNASSLPQKIIIGSGLSLNTSTYTLSATGGGGGGGSSALADLTDVTLTSPANNQLLRYNSGSSTWVNWTPDFLTTATAASTYLTMATAATTYQPLDSDLTSIAALSTTTHGRSLLTGADAAATRSTLGLGTLATQSGTITDYLTTTTADSTYVAKNSAATLTSLNTMNVRLEEVGGDTTLELTPAYLEFMESSTGFKTTILPPALGDLELSISLQLPSVGGTLLTSNSSLNGSNISSGTVAAARLGSGTSISTKFLRGDGTWQTISGGGDALTSGTLAQFASTTSAQLRGVLSDESGTGEFLTTNGSAASLTSFPTLNQNTTGNAATATALQTARTINGTSFDGTASITITAAAGTLTGTTLASNVTASSLTSVGTLTNLTVTNTITGSISGNAATVTTNANLTGDVTSVGNATSIGSGVIVNADISGSAAIALSKLATDPLARANHTGTQAASTITALPVAYGIAISDETTAITTGTNKVTFRMPHAMTVTAVRLSLSTVSSSGTPTVDINEAGTSILSTKLSCDANEKTSTTAATAPVISDSSLADDAEITIDIDTAGTGAAGAKVWIIGTR